MAFAIAALAGEAPSRIEGADVVGHFLPGLLRDTLQRLVGVKTDKVYLVGFMGAGKSSVARALARRLDWRAVDVDEMIEQREHQTVASIFARHGEPYFRAVERAGADGADSRTGIWWSPPAAAPSWTRRTVPSSTATALSVWLDVPIERLIARVPADGRRPLAADRAEFERLYVARRAAYEQAQLPRRRRPRASAFRRSSKETALALAR